MLEAVVGKTQVEGKPLFDKGQVFRIELIDEVHEFGHGKLFQPGFQFLQPLGSRLLPKPESRGCSVTGAPSRRREEMLSCIFSITDSATRLRS
jgi:hypothetical protein